MRTASGKAWFLVGRTRHSVDTNAVYESALTVKAYVELAAVGDPLPDMPLYLEPNGYVLVPLEATYQAAWSAVPRRWRTVLESSTS